MSNGHRELRGIPYRALVPNAVTAMALCLGLTGVRFGIGGEWGKAILAIVGAGVLDGMDGRIARSLKAQSKFGAELDSLSDNIAFGTAPALILYLWSLNEAPRFGWIAALALAVCCALRLARFNSQIDAEIQPHKSAGFNTGVPAPAGAGLAFLPMLLSELTGDPLFHHWALVMGWTLLTALLMISALPTYSWSSIRIRSGWRLPALAGVALLGAMLITQPLLTLVIIVVGYFATLPFSFAAYQRVKRRRATPSARAPGDEPILPAAGSAR